MVPLQHVGMALATSIAGWLNVVLMVRTLLKRKWLVIEKYVMVQTGKILVACAAMAFALANLHASAQPYFSGHEMQRFIALIVLSVAGCAVYVVMSLALNSMGLRQQISKRLLRKKDE